MIKNAKKYLGFIIILITILSIHSAFFTKTTFAELESGDTTGGFTNYKPLIPLPIGPNGSNETPTELSKYLPAMFQFFIGIAGVLAVVMIVIGGIQYMSTDAIYGKSAGKEKITQALGGLLLAIVAWLVLYSINPNLLNTVLGGPNTEKTKQTAVETYKFYAQIKTYPLLPGAPAKQTFCEGPFDEAVCAEKLDQLITSIYTQPNYNTYSSGCTTKCTPEVTPNQQWSVKVWENGGSNAFTACHSGYSNQSDCDAAKDAIRATYSPPFPSAPQPPYYTCVPKNQCTPSQ